MWTAATGSVSFDLIRGDESISTHRFTDVQANRTQLNVDLVRVLNRDINECSGAGRCDPDGGTAVDDIYDFTFDYPRAALPFSTVVVNSPIP